MYIDFLTGAFLVVGSAFLVQILAYFFITRKFIANAIRTKAKITSVLETSGPRTNIFTPVIAYSDLNGNDYTEPAAMEGGSSTVRNVNQVGDEVYILYNKDNPKLFMMDTWRGRYLYTLKRSAIVTLLVLVIGLALLFYVT